MSPACTEPPAMSLAPPAPFTISAGGVRTTRATEHAAARGHAQAILSERGLRTFEPSVAAAAGRAVPRCEARAHHERPMAASGAA